MGWEWRHNQHYYYHWATMADQQGRKLYVGRGAEAEALAALVEKRRQERAADRAVQRQEAEKWARVRTALDAVDGLAAALLKASLLLSGFRQHDRGVWRPWHGRGQANWELCLSPGTAPTGRACPGRR